LGADNGVGIALILAIFTDKTVNHGPLEALFTVQEETTTIGAIKLKND
jgi:dipeptidase D